MKKLDPQRVIIGLGLIAIAIMFLLKNHSRPASQPAAIPHVVLKNDPAVEIANELNAAVLKGDYATVSASLTKSMQESSVVDGRYNPFTDFASRIVPQNDAAFLNAVDNWLKQEPNSVHANILRGVYMFKHAWFVRGDKFVSNTPDDHIQTFAEEIKARLVNFQRAATLMPDSPYLAYQLVRLSNLAGEPPQKTEALFQQAAAKYPDYLDLYNTRIDQVAAKWGGSREAQQQFVDHYAGKAPANSIRKFLYLELFRAQVNDDKLFFHGTDEAWQAALAEYIASPAIVAGIASALELSKTMEPYRFNQIYTGYADDITTLQHADHFIDAFFRLSKEKLGNHNYAVNLLHGSYFYIKGLRNNQTQPAFMHQAIDYYNKALVNMEAFAFPDEAAKNKQLGYAYGNIAVAYDAMHDSANTLLYGEKALAHYGAQKGLAVSLCGWLFKQGQYQRAGDYCRFALTLKPFYGQTHGNARYWLGMVYTKLQPEDALAELTAAIADAGPYIKPLAIMQIGVMYSGQKKPREAIALYQAHPELFDAGKNKQIAAAAYSNICDDYMRIEDYASALASCEKSLAIAELPQARYKYNQLMKRAGR